MNDRFDGRTALITGGGSGIGRATAQRLASEGATVVISDVDQAGMEATLDNGGVMSAKVCNVADETQVQDLVASTVAEHGSLDIVVNLAGVLSFANSHEVTLDEWRRLIDVNLTGTFLVCRETLPHLCASATLRTEGSVLINTASTAAHIGQAWTAGYSATKGGILAMSRALAVEYGRRGVRVNTISPGGITTPIIEAFAFPEGADKSLLARTVPLGELGTPDDVAAGIAYLCSDEAAYLKGTDLRIDGATTT